MTLAPALRPFEIPQSLFPPSIGRLGRTLREMCERSLALPPLNDVYARAHDLGAGGFCERVLQTLDVRVDIAEAALASIPAQGPLIVVANHPFGGLDGVILTAILQRVRPDVRLLANYLLARIPEMAETCLFVDPFGGPAAADRNRAALRSAVDWVARGGALGVFPSGEVSHLTLKAGCVTDPTWSDSVARLALRTRATVVPVYFDGHNSRLFQLLGLVHPRLRTAMLPRELLRTRGQSVRIEIGSPIGPTRLDRLRDGGRADAPASRETAQRVTDFLRLRTYILKGRAGIDNRHHRKSAAPPAPQPIVPATPANLLTAEVAALPPQQCLAVSGSLRVYYSTAPQIPNLLREIGRLRETTFRLVGEGTGREIDLDRFDDDYLHLFVWNAEQRELVGAYRMGQSDVLLARSGSDGLYTSTLFRFQRRLLDQLSPALELGRSFVVPEYQRDYAPLLLLWKGIGRYVVQNPRYRRLFGAVSISDEFQSMTKQLLMAFLRANRFDESMAELVRPRTPPKIERFPHVEGTRMSALVNDLDGVEELVGEIESDRRGVPVLLRQYLKLNARLLGFNIDPDFGDVVDGLVVVDLPKVDRAVLNRYFGRDGAEAFLAYHGDACPHA